MLENSNSDTDLLQIYVDGASRGNPGPSAYGFIILGDGGRIIESQSGYLGKQTNNIAEYTAIIEALKTAKEFSAPKLRIFSDSQLVVRQLRGEYQIKASHLSKLAATVFHLCEHFNAVQFIHTERTHPNIQKCDRLCNQVLDQKGF